MRTGFVSFIVTVNGATVYNCNPLHEKLSNVIPLGTVGQDGDAPLRLNGALAVDRSHLDQLATRSKGSPRHRPQTPRIGPQGLFEMGPGPRKAAVEADLDLFNAAIAGEGHASQDCALAPA